MRANILTALLALVSFIAGAALRPMSKPSVVFRRPFEVSKAAEIPGPFLHVCICGQKIACPAWHYMGEKLENELAKMHQSLVELGIEQPKKEVSK